MEVKIELHSVDDWEALYVNGVSVYQTHRNTLSWWLNHGAKFPLNILSLVDEYHEGDALDEYACNTGGLPETLEELRALFK